MGPSAAATIRFDDKHYARVMERFGYEPSKFSRINFALRSIEEEDIQRRWLCHHGVDKICMSLEKGKKTIVSSGVGLSGEPHIGTISQIMRVIYLQRSGLDVNFILGDLDAYNGKNKELGYVTELAERYRDFIRKLGFKEHKGAILRSQNYALEVLRTMYLAAKYADEPMFLNAEEELHGFYAEQGKVDSTMSYRRRLSLNLMAADFIHLLINDQYDNVIVTLGLDEHQYVLFAANLLEKMTKEGEFQSEGKTIGGLYSPLIVGLYGYSKMSKSFPDSSITVSTPRDKVVKAIMDGDVNWDFPENNVVYQMMSAVSDYAADELRDIYAYCASKDEKWRIEKQRYAEVLLEKLSKWPGD